MHSQIWEALQQTLEVLAASVAAPDADAADAAAVGGRGEGDLVV